MCDTAPSFILQRNTQSRAKIAQLIRLAKIAQLIRLALPQPGFQSHPFLLPSNGQRTLSCQLLGKRAELSRPRQVGLSLSGASQVAFLPLATPGRECPKKATPIAWSSSPSQFDNRNRDSQGIETLRQTQGVSQTWAGLFSRGSSARIIRSFLGRAEAHACDGYEKTNGDLCGHHFGEELWFVSTTFQEVLTMNNCGKPNI